MEDKSPNKQEERSRATRERLIAAARELFAARGYAAVGTEEVVRAAGVTRGALYHQFRDGKEQLFEAVFEQVEAETTQRIAEMALTGATDPVAALRNGARAFLRICAEPEIERLALLDAPSVLGWARWREIGFEHGLGLVVATLQAGVDAGAIASQPLTPLAHLLLGALDEGALYVAQAADPDAARAEVEAVMDRLIDGLVVQS